MFLFIFLILLVNLGILLLLSGTYFFFWFSAVLLTWCVWLFLRWNKISQKLRTGTEKKETLYGKKKLLAGILLAVILGEIILLLYAFLVLYVSDGPKSPVYPQDVLDGLNESLRMMRQIDDKFSPED